MSRVRISPSEWRIEEPASAHLTRSVVPAVTVGYMRPTMGPIGSDLRRTSNAEASKRYRERHA